jgi:hypothetical protein
MVTFAQILEFIRSVSFGALAVNSILLLTFIYFPHLFPDGFTYKEVLYIGTAIGTVLHRALNALLFNPLTKSIARSFTFYAKLAEIHLLFKSKVLTEKQYNRIADSLKAEYFSIADRVLVNYSDTQASTDENTSATKSLDEEKYKLTEEKKEILKEESRLAADAQLQLEESTTTDPLKPREAEVKHVDGKAEQITIPSTQSHPRARRIKRIRKEQKEL